MLSQRSRQLSWRASTQASSQRRYDEENGQIYYESSCPESISLSKWLYAVKGSTKEFEDFKNPKGAATLEEMSMRTLLRYSDNLSVEALDGIPWKPIGRKMWERIRAA
jgi:hypothetical protein